LSCVRDPPRRGGGRLRSRRRCGAPGSGSRRIGDDGEGGRHHPAGDRRSPPAGRAWPDRRQGPLARRSSMKKASTHSAHRKQAAGASAPGQSPRRGMGSRSAAALALLLPLAAAHAVELPRVFGEGMVLQRDQPIPVWGRADAGAQVRVALGDQRVETRAGADGHWRVELAPRTAGGPLVMRVDDGKAPVELGDVMIGDVWLASGQSNMEWRLSESADAEVEIARADRESTRLNSSHVKNSYAGFCLK